MPPSLFIFFQKIAPQHLLSRVIGKLAACQNKTIKNFFITSFIKKYAVNMQEALLPTADGYSNFNAFFTRELKPNSRIIAIAEHAIVSPADGVISAIGNINNSLLVQAKGKYFSLLNLLGGNKEHAALFENGDFATIYLSPKDYHRVHMPYTGILQEMIFVPGKLFSVNQTTSENIPDLFARNERVICIFKTDIGPMAVILVGAMIVASIETVWAGQVAPATGKLSYCDYRSNKSEILLEKGMEVGRFKLGSTAIVLFSQKAMAWDNASINNTVVRMGQQIGLSSTLGS